MITPNTTIVLLKSPLTLSNKNQMTFASKTAQYNYFYSLPKLIEEDCMYQRKDNVIRFPAHADTLQEYNYCMYQNENYGNKWFYAFITKIDYVNDNCSYITIKTDTFQTWQFDLLWKQSFVEREHVQDDTIGLHTVPENLDIGELICERTRIVDELGAESYFYFVIACNYDPSNQTRTAGVGIYGGYPQGSMWFAWLINFNNPTDINDVSQWVYDVTQQGHAEDITAMFALPYQAFNLNDIDSTTHKVTNGLGVKLDTDITLSKSAYCNFNDFSPKNNKVYTYPYNFVRVTNNAGSFNDYKIEDFLELDVDDQPTNNFVFNLIGVPCIGYSGKIRPKHYQGIINNEDESISLGKYPALSWSTDAFTNWITQNGVNLVLNTASSFIDNGISMFSNASKGNEVGIAQDIINIERDTANTIGQMFKAGMLPNRAEGNANAGDVSFAFNLSRFKIMQMRSKTEYLQTIDSYFSMYGYKVNLVKIPNLTNRPNWNYVKTVGANILGNIPQQDLAEIKNFFNNGITLWHNPSTFLDYSQNNS